MEQVLARLRGVVSSRIVTREGDIQEVHILAGLGRPAKHIVRDVETALYAQFALPIDHRVISIAQLDSAAEYVPESLRLIFSSLKTEMTSHSSVVHVGLEMGEQTFAGYAEGPRKARNHGRIAAKATLNALQSVLQPSGRLVLDHIVHVTVGARNVCTVSLRFSNNGSEERLLGSALVEADHFEPAVKSVLMAINRRLTYIVDVSQLTSE